MFGLEHLMRDKVKYQVRSSARCPSFLYSLRQCVVTEVSRNVPVLASVVRTAVTNALIQQMKSGIPQWNMEMCRRKRSSDEETGSPVGKQRGEAGYEDDPREG